MVQKCVPFLIGHLKDSAHNDIILNILIEIAGYEPVALNSFLPMLKEIGERFPYLLGQMARIYGAVGHVDEVSLAFLSLHFPKFHWHLICWSSMTYTCVLGLLRVPISLSNLLQGQWLSDQGHIEIGLHGKFRKGFIAEVSPEEGERL